jgi:hypothetical protein
MLFLSFCECISLGFSAHCLSCVSYSSVLKHVICLIGNVGNTKFCMLGFSNLCIRFLLSAGLTRFFLYLVSFYFETKLQECYIVSYMFVPLVFIFTEEHISV